MKKLVLLLLGAALAGCSSADKRTGPGAGCPPCPPAAAPSKAAEIFPVAAPDLPLFSDSGDRQTLLKAAALNSQYLAGLKNGSVAYTFGGRAVTAADLAASAAEFTRLLETVSDQPELDRIIKEKFDIFQLAGKDSTGTVVFSSYYEPALEASLERTGEYRYPIYSKPDDLVSVNLEDFGEKFRGEKITGRVADGSLKPYLTREEIDFGGALDGKGLELAWFKDRADIMDLHIEGSGRLSLPDGSVVKAGFSSTNSLKFKGWLSALVESGALPREGLTHEKGKQYLLDHPDRMRGIMSQNRRYTFFRLTRPADPEEGPRGTYGLPLTGWRSAAVDNSIIPMGTIAFMRVATPDVDAEGNMLGKKQDSRFVFCQDTGGAIKGPGRVDFFAGHGKKSRTFAFKLWDQGTLYLLVLKGKP